jgi:RND superfamily putative drug exporter
MSMFLTPALTAIIGHAAWWPGHQDRQAPKELSEVPSDEDLSHR